MSRVVLLGLVLALGGCQALAAAPDTELDLSSSSQESPPSPEDSANPLVGGFRECEPSEVTEVFEVVSGQAEALGQGDFAAAYQYASPVFRLGVTEAAFEQLITSSYRPLIEATRLEVTQCVIDPEREVVSLDVRVTSDAGVWTLLYLIEGTEEGWRVGGAADLLPLSPESTVA